MTKVIGYVVAVVFIVTLGLHFFGSAAPKIEKTQQSRLEMIDRRGDGR